MEKLVFSHFEGSVYRSKTYVNSGEIFTIDDKDYVVLDGKIFLDGKELPEPEKKYLADYQVGQLYFNITPTRGPQATHDYSVLVQEIRD